MAKLEDVAQHATPVFVYMRMKNSTRWQCRLCRITVVEFFSSDSNPIVSLRNQDVEMLYNHLQTCEVAAELSARVRHAKISSSMEPASAQ